MHRVGIISGRETFTRVLLEALNRVPGIQAEWCQVTEPRNDLPNPYRVIVDRLSHCHEYYQAYLKHAVLTGTYVINNPFWFRADDKFFNYSLAARLGVAVPRTLLLPSREYDERVLEPDDLHNIRQPIPWEWLLQQVGGYPVILKPYDGYGWREVYRIDTPEQLLEVYEDSMMDVMMLQEFIDFEHYVRCFVVGKRHVLPTHYDPLERRYILNHEHLTPDLGTRIVSDCVKICTALGYDINTVEFAIRKGVPYAIDFMNPVPEAKPEVITPHYFHWLVEKVRDMVVDYAFSGVRTPYRMTGDFPVNPLPAPAASRGWYPGSRLDHWPRRDPPPV
ncbi:MAG: hypothetical protein HY319_01935 [Armatimonadetes bacterium]|nr:hypothetical protein [Armatimonadota bacterium]